MIELAFRPDRSLGEPVHRQLADYLTDLIGSERLAPGERLPPTRALRGALLGAPALFFVAHAPLHVFDTAGGVVEADHWWIDLPTVYGPGILAPLLSLYWLRRGSRVGAATR